MIEADLNHCTPIPKSKQAQANQTFISYEDFFSNYWPHFPQPLTKGLGKIYVFHSKAIN
jgi:hypothetical protein